MKNKKIILGICIITLLILIITNVNSQSQNLPSYLNQDDEWELKQVNGENYYISPDERVVIHVDDNIRGTLILLEDINGQITPIPKTLILNEGRDTLRYIDGRIEAVDIEGGAQNDYKVVSTRIDVRDSQIMAYSDTTYVTKTEPLPNAQQYLGTAKTSVDLGTVYPDSAFSPSAVTIGDDIIEMRRQAITDTKGPFIEPFVIPNRMESEDVKEFIKTAYGVEIPQDVEINNAYLKDIAKQMGKDPSNFVFDVEMADAIAEIYIPDPIVNRISGNRGGADDIIQNSFLVREGTLTSQQFSIEGNALEGKYYTDSEGKNAFVTKEGTVFLQDKSNPDLWACAKNCGSSTGRNFPAQQAFTGYATDYEEGVNCCIS
jgi:hypothetical protein